MKLAILICVSVLIYLSAADEQQQSQDNNVGCTREYKPVCGDDGTTYSNECMLHWESNRKSTAINVDHEGPCVTS